MPYHVFEKVVLLLRDEPGSLMKLCQAATEIVEGIFGGHVNISKRAMLEDVSLEDVMDKPRGSDQQLALLEWASPSEFNSPN